MKSRRHGKPKRRTVIVALIALFAFYLLLSFFLGERGVVKDVKLRREKAELEKDVRELTDANKGLSREVEMLKDDPEYIERIARERGLAREGETVYQYEDGN